MKSSGSGLRRAATQAVALGAAAALAGTFAIPAFATTASDPWIEADAEAGVAVEAQGLRLAAVGMPDVEERDGYLGEVAEPTSEQLAAQYRTLFTAGQSFPIGDDYPLKDSSNPGGQSSLRYTIRTCTDFVAWRLNRDAGSFGEPWLMDWGYLTPTGGNGRQWAAAWEHNGWATSDVPVAGAVAWFGNNHVGYVAEVYDNGTLLVEDYNYQPFVYGARVYQWDDMALYLYPPPLP